MSEPVAALWKTLELLVDTTTRNDERILGLLDRVTDRVIAQDTEIAELREGLAALSNPEIAELREGLAALSNRIEALTQAGLHSVKA